jgi:phosphatidylglycerol---prolipoprotein diacylglyceryl transferase
MHPILLRIGNLPPLHTFGVMLALGILLGWWMLTRETVRLGDPQITPQRIGRLAWYIVLAVVAGGRLMYVITSWHEFAERPLAIFAVWQGGLVMYGGLIAVFLTVIGYAAKNRINVLRLCDLVAPSCFLGDVVGRWGCFFAGDDYGKETSSWLGVTFTDPESLVPKELLGHPLYPTQIFMSLKALVIFVVLIWITRRKKFDGQVAGWALMLYAVLRSIIEFFRGDLDRGFVGPMSTAQFTSIFMFAVGLVILLVAPRRLLADDLRDAEAAAQAAGGKKRKKGRANAVA